MNEPIMLNEAKEAPVVIENSLKANAPLLQELRQRWRKFCPRFVITVARGSSDHACTYAKYLLETKLGLVTSSAAPSIVTIYQAKLDLREAVVLAVSQSGQSPDLCCLMEEARQQGALTIALVNKVDSPLAKASEFVLPLLAGEERAVAATKSYIASLVVLAQMVAVLAEDVALQEALLKLPAALNSALSCDWQSALAEFKEVQRTFVIGRGFSFPIAQEAALKFKETAVLQAEAFSAAELLHGPFTLVRKNQPFLLFTQNDATLPGVFELVKKMQSINSKVIMAKHADTPLPENFIAADGMVLPLPPSLHATLDPILTIQAFYPFVAALALARGFDPDNPENLKKVTETY